MKLKVGPKSKCGSYAPGTVLTTCEMYLRNELVKHLLRHEPQNYAKHTFDKISPKTFVQTYPSTNLIISSGPKLFIIFCRIFSEKNKKTLGTYLPEIFLGNLLGWLVSSQKFPKNIFGNYPSTILLEISPTNSPYQNFLVDISYIFPLNLVGDISKKIIEYPPKNV